MVTGRLTANMPTKCIDQMPAPMVTAAPESKALRRAPFSKTRRLASCRPAKEPRIAMAIESATSSGS